MNKPNPMNLSGAARVLGAAAAFDKRTVGEADAVAWADALHHLDPADCIRAVGDHYARTNDYLMPHHIRVRVREIIRERQDKAAVERGLPTGPPASAATRAEVRAAVRRVLTARQSNNGDPSAPTDDQEEFCTREGCGRPWSAHDPVDGSCAASGCTLFQLDQVLGYPCAWASGIAGPCVLALGHKGNHQGPDEASEPPPSGFAKTTDSYGRITLRAIDPNGQLVEEMSQSQPLDGSPVDAEPVPTCQHGETGPHFQGGATRANIRYRHCDGPVSS